MFSLVPQPHDQQRRIRLRLGNLAASEGFTGTTWQRSAVRSPWKPTEPPQSITKDLLPRPIQHRYCIVCITMPTD